MSSPPPPPGVFFEGSPGLLWQILDRSPRECVALNDSEDLSDLEDSLSVAPSSPPLQPLEKGKVVAETSRKRSRTQRHRPRKHSAGIMVDAREAYYTQPPNPTRMQPASVIVAPPPSNTATEGSPASPPAAHPPREYGEPDGDGFFNIRSRRFGCQRTLPHPRSPKKVPPELQGKCFRYLRDNHDRVQCTFSARCYNC